MMRQQRAKWAGGLVATLLAFGAFAAPVEASGVDGNNQFSGEAIIEDECAGAASLLTFAMEGDLVGCWYTTDLAVTQETPSGIYQERGTETFAGCLVREGETDVCGTFDTTYTFTAKFDEAGEVHGRCQHPIVAGSGTGGFEGATGRVDFKDEVATGQFFFRGHIKLA